MFRKSFNILISILLFLVFTFILNGCEKTNVNNNTQINKENKLAESTPNIPPKKSSYTYINPDEVEWMTMHGGGKSITTKVLFPGHDGVKIDKIVNMINSSSSKEKLMEKEIGGQSVSWSRGIHIKLKAGNEVFVWPTYKITSHKNGFTATPLKDKFILQTEENGQEKYYTLLSKNVASYLRKGWISDMPQVNMFSIKAIPEKKHGRVVLKEGGKYIVSGDGCTSGEISVFIRRNGHDKEEYLIAKITPSYGKWQWEGTVNKSFLTLDGKKVTLAKDYYDIMVGDGNAESGASSVIDLRDN